MIWYDKDNNFIPTTENAMQLTSVNYIRLALAAEFMRCKVYGGGGIDSALDDADTAIGFLSRIGIIEFKET